MEADKITAGAVCAKNVKPNKTPVIQLHIIRLDSMAIKKLYALMKNNPMAKFLGHNHGEYNPAVLVGISCGTQNKSMAKAAVAIKGVNMRRTKR